MLTLIIFFVNSCEKILALPVWNLDNWVVIGKNAPSREELEDRVLRRAQDPDCIKYVVVDGKVAQSSA